ncbi:o-succinylbenzoate synthase [Dokdonia sinensis]|uniref:O-succinylbenzoate synthase n=1 Tax=Dokdonia sinensis TaxID=2479847 RepID=A0A3M0GH19_9FLAO|nr:o-succinylbenzoate synthase [Dokdonia sinensis]RMB63964.1 o-succinylbenzoate synthase [Dokdonia sinensis]
MTATYQKYILEFKRPSGTSRGILKTKETWFINIESEGKCGIGECGILRGLSYDDRPDYEEKLKWTCKNIALGMYKLWEQLAEFPSIQAGVEMAFMSLEAAHPFELFPSAFTRGQEAIDINGLIWMGDEAFMKDQIDEKLESGFNCIKMKIGAIDLDNELKLLSFIRKHCSPEQMTLRVDANGAFTPKEAPFVLKELSELNIHSIEQPIKAGQNDAMRLLCKTTPVPIALDEELIGITTRQEKKELLETVNPQFIILKPSFVGGFRGSQEWIDIANTLGIGWWITSALESNVGLSAIAQWTYIIGAKGHQGLGTGSLYTNNIPSPLMVKEGKISYNPNLSWDLNNIK